MLGGYATTSFANDDTAKSVSDTAKWDMKGFGHKGFFGGNSDELLAKAKELGITTSGKIGRASCWERV